MVCKFKARSRRQSRSWEQQPNTHRIGERSQSKVMHFAETNPVGEKVAPSEDAW